MDSNNRKAILYIDVEGVDETLNKPNGAPWGDVEKSMIVCDPCFTARLEA
jgi:hypothetical protein